MSFAILILLAQAPTTYQPHSRELPVTAVEWIDHYGYCLEVNHMQLTSGVPGIEIGRAAKRAAVRCWPVRASAHGKIIKHLLQDEARADVNEREEIADRVLNMAARDFALRVGASLNDLTELCAPYTQGDCNASD